MSLVIVKYSIKFLLQAVVRVEVRYKLKHLQLLWGTHPNERYPDSHWCSCLRRTSAHNGRSSCPRCRASVSHWIAYPLRISTRRCNRQCRSHLSTHACSLGRGCGTLTHDRAVSWLWQPWYTSLFLSHSRRSHWSRQTLSTCKGLRIKILVECPPRTQSSISCLGQWRCNYMGQQLRRYRT